VRRLLACLIFSLCLAAAPASAEPAAPLRVQPGDQAVPGDASWPLGARFENGARLTVSADDATPGGFRIDIAPPPNQKPGPTRACLGLASTTRRDLYKTRAVEFRIKASRAVAGILVVTSSNTQDNNARDRFFGSFVIGEEWKTLRLPYGALAPLTGWDTEAQRLGLRPGDLVLRPDSVEDLCIGAEAGRLPEGPLSINIDGLRFVR